MSKKLKESELDPRAANSNACRLRAWQERITQPFSLRLTLSLSAAKPPGDFNYSFIITFCAAPGALVPHPSYILIL